MAIKQFHWDWVKYETGYTLGVTYGVMLEGQTQAGLWARGPRGVFARGTSEAGVVGMTDAAERGGVHGENGNRSAVAYGVTGIIHSPNGAAVAGQNFGTGTAIQGFSTSGTAIQGVAESDDGVQGFTSGKSKGLLGGLIGSGGGWSGVLGHNNIERGLGYGVRGLSNSDEGAGVFGQGRGKRASGVFGGNSEGAGVSGISNESAGVFGMSNNGHGIAGSAAANLRCGVFGINAPGIGVGGRSLAGIGVLGWSDSGHGVVGRSDGADVAGVAGLATQAGLGVRADALDPTGIALFAKGPNAARFEGDVVVAGNFMVIAPGTKNAVVALKDGSHRLVCAIESPEAWFEDFGEAKLVKGTAHVLLDPEFAQVVDTASYHVFITAYGDCGGLYVSKRTAKGFDVTEHGGGQSQIAFSWRVVARPKNAKKERFAKAPALANLPDRKEKRWKAPDLTAFRKMDTGTPALELPKLPKLLPPKKPKPAFGKTKVPKTPRLPRAKRPAKLPEGSLGNMLVAPSAKKPRSKRRRKP
jgi:hypothetical protein